MKQNNKKCCGTALEYICGAAFKISEIKLERSRDSGKTSVTTKSDQLSEEMREIFKNSQSGDSLQLIFKVENQGKTHEISKSIIVAF